MSGPFGAARPRRVRRRCARRSDADRARRSSSRQIAPQRCRNPSTRRGRRRPRRPTGPRAATSAVRPPSGRARCGSRSRRRWAIVSSSARHAGAQRAQVFLGRRAGRRLLGAATEPASASGSCRSNGRHEPAPLELREVLGELCTRQHAGQLGEIALSVDQDQQLAQTRAQPVAAGAQFVRTLAGLLEHVLRRHLHHGRPPGAVGSGAACANVPAGAPNASSTMRLSNVSLRWKKWSAPGRTTTGRSCRRAQSKTACKGTVSSISPCTTRVSGAPARRRNARRPSTNTRRSAGCRLAQPRRHLRLDEAAEREAGQHETGVGEPDRRRLLARVPQDCEQVLGLADAFVVAARRFPHAAEVRSPGDETQRDQRACEGLDHLVVARAAEQRMRVRNDRDPRRVARRQVERQVDRAGRTVDEQGPGRRVHSSRSRATGRPSRRWDSTISSMSLRST